MKKPKILLILAIFVLLTLACGLPNGISGLVGGGEAGTVTEMWPDVPVMDGLNKAKLDLPLPAKLALQGFIKSSSKGDAALNFISYTTTKQPQEVYDYYSQDKMNAEGWSMPDQPGCTGDPSGTTSAGVCLFGKDQGDNSASFLAVFVTSGSDSNETSVFFIRADAKNLPDQQP